MTETKTLTLDNNSSFRETFDEILSNYNSKEIKVINGITFNSYDFSKIETDVIYNTIKQILKDIPYRRLCLTFQLENNNKILKIECCPYIGSA